MAKTVVSAPPHFVGQKLAYSNAIRAGDFIFLAGQAPLEEDGSVAVGGIEAQTRRAMENVRRVLDDAGAGFEDIVRTNVYLSNPRDFWQFNTVYKTYFENDPPTRTTVHAPLVIDAKIEIEVIVYKPL